MREATRGMDAVVTKSERRHVKSKGAFRRKGAAKDAATDEATPGIAIMIGVPKGMAKGKPPKDTPMRDTPTRDIETELMELKARVIALEAMLDKDDPAMMDEDEDEDDEDEA